MGVTILVSVLNSKVVLLRTSLTNGGHFSGIITLLSERILVASDTERTSSLVLEILLHITLEDTHLSICSSTE